MSDMWKKIGTITSILILASGLVTTVWVGGVQIGRLQTKIEEQGDTIKELKREQKDLNNLAKRSFTQSERINGLEKEVNVLRSEMRQFFNALFDRIEAPEELPRHLRNNRDTQKGQDIQKNSK